MANLLLNLALSLLVARINMLTFNITILWRDVYVKTIITKCCNIKRC